MRVRVEIHEDGSVKVFTESGTFSEGVEMIANVLDRLGAAGVSFGSIAEAEQHRHHDQVVESGVYEHDH
jgi:hypothetical protein